MKRQYGLEVFSWPTWNADQARDEEECFRNVEPKNEKMLPAFMTPTHASKCNMNNEL